MSPYLCHTSFLTNIMLTIIFFITEALFNKEKGDDILWKFGFIMHTTFITIQLIEITDWAQKKYNDQRPGISK